MTRSYRTKQKETPWWLTEVEICGTCGHAFAYQTEFYCGFCDRAVCAICIEQTAAMELICQDCIASPEIELEVSF
jgi:hypothetical protein